MSLFTPFAIFTGGKDADATAYINAVISAGGTLSDGNKIAINTFFVDLKNIGVYSKMIAFWPIMGGTANSHAINGNLNSTYDLTYFGTWTHNSSGQKPNGASGTYANTHYVIPTGYTGSGAADNLSFGLYINDITGTAPSYELDMGVRIPDPDNTHIYWIGAKWGATNTARYSQQNNGPHNGNFTNVGNGQYMISRTASNLFRLYENGVNTQNLGASHTSDLGSGGYSFYLGALATGTANQFNSFYRQCFSFISSGLDNTESINLQTAINDLQTSIGRNTY